MKQSDKKNGHYRAFIAGNQYSNAFDFCDSKSRASAVTSIKRRNKGWQDCSIWSVYIMPGGIDQCCKKQHGCK